jgi:hypothetical protein
MRFRPPNKRARFIIVGAALCACVLVYAYFMGDQANSVGWSASFSIDTQEPLSQTQPISSVAEAFSGQFAIDTRDPDSISRPTSYAVVFSAYFTIDTRDPDSVSRPLSLVSEEASSFFTIDTRADSAGYTTSGFFVIDTRDPDTIWKGLSLAVADTSAFFTIDTLDPPPEDTDNDGLHDIWEGIYFGPNLLLTDSSTDWDGDGYSNFAEFAFGMNPKVPDASPLRDQRIESFGEEQWFYISYTRHILAVRMVDYMIESSDTLAGWEDITTEIEEVEPVESVDGAVEIITIRYRLPLPMPESAFFRVKAKRKQ